jgi:hypothetical protein
MKPSLRMIALFLITGFCVAASPAVGAQQTPYWPSEREERLDSVESMITGTMRKLATARYYGRDDEAAQLLKDLEVLKRQEAQLLEPPVSAESAQK